VSPLVNDNISANVKESEKLILDPHLDPDHHHLLIASWGSPFAYACHVWSSIICQHFHELFCWQTERANDRTQRSHNSAHLAGV